MQERSNGYTIYRALDRMYVERPEAMENFLEWILNPSHTQTVTLRFREGKLQTVELTRTSR
jgi:hypothetical protein